MSSLQKRLANRQSPKVRSARESKRVEDAITQAQDLEVLASFGGDIGIARGTITRDGPGLALRLTSTLDARKAVPNTGLSLCVPTLEGMIVLPTQMVTFDPSAFTAGVAYLRMPECVLDTDYRNSVRLTVGDDAKLDIDVGDGGPACEVVDVSVAGIQIDVEGEEALRPGETCRLKVRHGDQETLREAEVRWARGTRRGLTFLDKTA